MDIAAIAASEWEIKTGPVSTATFAVSLPPGSVQRTTIATFWSKHVNGVIKCSRETPASMPIDACGIPMIGEHGQFGGW